jgi:hypothetical protein
MKRRYLPVFAAVLSLLPLLCACGAGRDAAAGKLIAGYYKITDASTVTVLKTESFGNGYLALAVAAGGSHLALFKVEKDAISAVSEGIAGKDGGYSLNILADNGKTVLFGNLGNTKGARILFTFDDGSQASAQAGSAGYIAIAAGSLKVKDFTLYGPGNAAVSTYREFVAAGGSIVRTGFVPVKGQ